MMKKFLVVAAVAIVLTGTGCSAIVGTALALPGAALTTARAAHTLASMQIDGTIAVTKGGVAVAEGGFKAIDTAVDVVDHIGEASHKAALRRAERTALAR